MKQQQNEFDELYIKFDDEKKTPFKSIKSTLLKLIFRSFYSKIDTLRNSIEDSYHYIADLYALIQITQEVAIENRNILERITKGMHKDMDIDFNMPDISKNNNNEEKPN